MSCLNKSEPDYETWRVGASRCAFRGAAPDLARPYIAVLGGSETFGRFVERPYPALLAEKTGIPVANLSVMHAGLTLIRREPAILSVAQSAAVTIVPLLGAANTLNALYHVHPWRNDRFVEARQTLRKLFPSVDFARINFTGHLMETLEAADPWAFDTVIETLRACWVEDMRAVLGTIPGPRVLLWMSRRDFDAPARGLGASTPLFVDRGLLPALEGSYEGLVEVVASAEARRSDIGDGSVGKQHHAAHNLPNAAFHAEVAEALAPAVRRLKEKRRAGNADAPPLDQSQIRASR